MLYLPLHLVSDIGYAGGETVTEAFSIMLVETIFQLVAFRFSERLLLARSALEFRSQLTDPRHYLRFGKVVACDEEVVLSSWRFNGAPLIRLIHAPQRFT